MGRCDYRRSSAMEVDMNAYYFCLSQRLLIWLGCVEQIQVRHHSTSLGMPRSFSCYSSAINLDEATSRESHVFYIHITFRLFRAVY